ncbi:hypothetical protein HD806DRAFT_522330 [Xylariaceae sp. AK1471]|nr:hypothetical protein HD806DRAFT_522330 [Xylariaceae sp. AK1471]
MAAAFTPHWKEFEYPLHKSRGQISGFSNCCGIGGQHRLLAVIRRSGSVFSWGFASISVRDVLASCLRVIIIFSDPTNRMTIESERALAIDRPPMIPKIISPCA